MKKSYAIALAVAVSCLAVFWLWPLLSRATPERLLARALTAATLSDRMNAAMALSMTTTPDTSPHLRRLLKESKDPEVIAQGFSALAFRLHADSFSEFVAALDHEAIKVRQAAHAGVLRFHGGAMPEGLEYAPDAPPEERARVVRQLQDINQRKGPAFDLFAAAPSADVPPITKEPATKEPATNAPKESASKDAPKEAAPPSSALSTTPPYTPTAPFTPVEYPAINVLVWMLQGIAVLVLIFDAAGALSLILSRKRSGKPLAKRDTHLAAAHGTLPAARQTEAEAAEKSSAVLWIKIALLIAGVVCTIALLTAAEMVRLAVRMEQKIDYTTRIR